MKFTDIHMHLLYGVDDGATDAEEMQKILDAAYADGTRTVCATPHYHPGYFGYNSDASAAAFEKLKEYATEKYPDMRVCLGNELRYGIGTEGWLRSGACRSLNGSRYVLVDFLEHTGAEQIIDCTMKLLNIGYIPILAHAERYENFHRDNREVRRLSTCGVIIQIDSQSPFGGWGTGAKRRSRSLIEHYCTDVVASDAHDVSGRPPQLSACYEYVTEKCGREYADRIFKINPLAILNDEELRKEDEL